MNERQRRQQLIRQTAWVGPVVRHGTTALLGLLAGLWLGHATVTRLWRYDKERFEEMTDWVLLGFPLAGLIIGLVASDSLLRIFRGRRM